MLMMLACVLCQFNLACMGDSEGEKKKEVFNILKPRVVDTLQDCTVAVFEPPERMSENRL